MYYEVPEEIVEDDEQLAEWAREAVAGKHRDALFRENVWEISPPAAPSL